MSNKRQHSEYDIHDLVIVATDEFASPLIKNREGEIGEIESKALGKMGEGFIYSVTFKDYKGFDEDGIKETVYTTRQIPEKYLRLHSPYINNNTNCIDYVYDYKIPKQKTIDVLEKQLYTINELSSEYAFKLYVKIDECLCIEEQYVIKSLANEFNRVYGLLTNEKKKEVDAMIKNRAKNIVKICIK